MTTRAVSPGSGWRWFRQAINLGRNNPKAVFGAVALLAVIALIPSVIQLVLQYGLGLGPEAVMTVIGLTTVASILVYPLLIGGLLRVIHAAENGQPTHATAIFDTFHADNGRGRLIGFGLLMTAIYVGVFLLVMPIYVGMLLVVYVVMFGVMYFVWRDVCGDEPTPAPPSDDRIEL